MQPQNHLEFLKPFLKDSTKQFLSQYRSGRTNFSDFDSIFTRVLHDLPDPPLEIVWFYSAVRFHSSKLDSHEDSVESAGSLFQLLVSLSDSFSAAKRLSLLSPLVYNLSRLVVTRRRDALFLLERILSYVTMYCVQEEEEEDDLVMVLGFSFADSIRVWVVDEAEVDCSVDDCLEIFFMPFVSERLRKEIDSESCSVGYLAGIVASQVFLLSLCLRFDSELSRIEVEKDLRESVFRMGSWFRNSYFVGVIVKILLLEPHLHLSSLLGPEDGATLIKTIKEAVIELVEKLFLNPVNGSLRLKNIAINWLFLFDTAMASLRTNNDEEETKRYMNIFSNSRIPYHLINWVISKGIVVREAYTLLKSTPSSFIEWLVSLEEQGLKVFDCDYSKNYAKTVVHRSRPSLRQEECDQDAYMADGNIVSSISILSRSTRKRKEEKHHKECEMKVKLFKHSHNNNFQENSSKFLPFVFSNSLVNGTEIEVSDMEI
ncbi:unnamed protein product [Cochlearia groenlandica]